jgi:hypothetical protein
MAATNWSPYETMAPTFRACGVGMALSEPYKDIIGWGTTAQVRRVAAVLGLSADDRTGKCQDYRDLAGKKVATLGYCDETGRASITLWWACAVPS